MLRITRASGVDGEHELRVEGWVAGEYVALLEQAGQEYWRDPGRQVLDLAGLQSIDQAGIALLQRWAEAGVVFRGCSPYIRIVLAQHQLRCEEEPLHGG